MCARLGNYIMFDSAKTGVTALHSWLVHTADKTVLSRLDPVSTSPRWQCEHNWRRDKTVLSCLVGGVNTTAVQTLQLCLLSRPRRWCEQAIRNCISASSLYGEAEL